MTRMLAEDISTWPDNDPQLIGSRCTDCGATTFPIQAICPRCSCETMSDLLLPRHGTLVAWTTQGFLPGRPYAGSETAETFEPFGMGLVQLGDVIKVEGRLTEGDPEKLRFGMEVELTMRPLYTDDDGDEVLMFAFAPVTAAEGERFMNDVAIIGVGLHPFGRFGDKTAMAMGADAIQLALSDAGVTWRDIQFGVGGSHTVTNPNAVSSLVGLSGIPFTDVFNACATSASAVQVAADAIRAGRADVAIAFGMDKHPRGAFVGDPANLALPKWYGENGQYITTKFFGMNANRYCHDHGISSATLAKVAAKNFRNGVLNPNAFRRDPISEAEILNSRMVNYPLTQYMFCAPDEGAAAAVLCRADLADRYSSTPVFVRATEIRSRIYGAYEVHASYAAVEEDEPPTARASRAAFESAGIAPEDVDVIQLQDTEAGAEVIAMGEAGFCAHGDQEKLVAEGATEIDGPMPINTDGGLIANGEPIGASGLRQVHELVRQLRGEAGDRQVPGNPRVGFAQVYGAPGTAAATILST